MDSNRRVVRLLAALAIAVGTGAGPAAGQEVVPLDDPELLERLGWPAEARGLTITPRALAEAERERAAEAAGRELEEEVEAAGEPAAIAPETGYSVVTPASFQAVDPGTVFFITDVPSLLCASGDSDFEAQIPDLPHGGTLAGARAWYSDAAESQALSLVLYRSCLPTAAAGTPASTTLGTHVSFTNAGNRTAFLSVDDPIDTESCAYLVRLRLGSSCPGASMSFYKLRLAWTPPAEPAGPVVFESGFESGTLAGWNPVQP